MKSLQDVLDAVAAHVDTLARPNSPISTADTHAQANVKAGAWLASLPQSARSDGDSAVVAARVRELLIAKNLNP